MKMSSQEKRALLAMSGGVDSSVAACLLLEAGYEVTGVFMCLGTDEGAPGGCCSPQDAADARRVADRLGIDMFVLNVGDEFRPIVEGFLAEYERGRTPNPCIHCNALVKFGHLVARADSLGIGWVATGHHARIVRGRAGSPAIARGLARDKDQSYALFAVGRDVLGRVLLPVGEVADKGHVRGIARRLGLHVHDKSDSQEICFVPDDDYAALLRARRPRALRGGDIVDSSGRVLGRHDGYARYTIGQRRGLGVAAGEPMYVTRIDPATATVTIGPRDEVMGRRLIAAGANWHADMPPEEPLAATVQIRYNHAGATATVRRTGDDRFEVHFDQPVCAITPGQAAVVYDGDELLGGGWIESRGER